MFLRSPVILRYLHVKHTSVDGHPQPVDKWAFSGSVCCLMKQVPAIGQVDCTPGHPRLILLLLQRKPLLTSPSALSMFVKSCRTWPQIVRASVLGKTMSFKSRGKQPSLAEVWASLC